MKSKKIRFSIFRYQLLPNTHLQFDLFDSIKSREELVEKKNNIFKQIVTDENTHYKGKGYKVIGKVEYQKDEDILLKLGVEKSKEIHRPDFNKETIKDYPNIIVYINNLKDKQFLIVENNTDAFSDSISVVNILKKTLGDKLKNFKLSLHIEQTFDENQFWDTIRMYQGRITAIKFEFIRPNISNISGKIKESLSIIENDLNGHIIDLNIYAPKEGIIENLEPGNQIVEGLLSYNKEGGGKPPEIKAKGIRRQIKTVKTEKSFEIDEYSGSSETLINLLKKMTE